MQLRSSKVDLPCQLPPWINGILRKTFKGVLEMPRSEVESECF